MQFGVGLVVSAHAVRDAKIQRIIHRAAIIEARYDGRQRRFRTCGGGGPWRQRKVTVNRVAFLGSERAPKPIEAYQCIDEFALNLLYAWN
jgi:hypothetical protein